MPLRVIRNLRTRISGQLYCYRNKKCPAKYGEAPHGERCVVSASSMKGADRANLGLPCQLTYAARGHSPNNRQLCLLQPPVHLIRGRDGIRPRSRCTRAYAGIG